MGGGPSIQVRGGRTIVHIPMTFQRRGGRKEIIVPEGLRAAGRNPGAKAPTALAVALARAHRWQRLIEDGRHPTITDLAAALGVDRTYVSRMLRLTLLAPDIVEAIAGGAEPAGLTFRRLVADIPKRWAEQRRLLGFPAR